MRANRTAPRIVVLAAGLLVMAAAQGAPRFRIVPIDAGMAESSAVADINNDGRLDIVSAESWYEAPAWSKRSIRTIPLTSGYVDSFSDLHSTWTATASPTWCRSATSRAASSG